MPHFAFDIRRWIPSEVNIGVFFFPVYFPGVQIPNLRRWPWMSRDCTTPTEMVDVSRET